MLLLKKVKNRWVGGLILIYFIYFAMNVWVLSQDNIYPLYDSSETVGRGYKIANDLLTGRLSYPWIEDQYNHSPFVSYILSLNIILFGGDIDILMHTNMLFLAILIYALYNLGKIIADRSVGFLSSVICLSFPVVIGFSRIMWNEFPIMCVVALSYYFLFKTNYFTDRKYSLFWSVSIACGLLIRFTMLLYVAVPVFLYIMKAFLIRKDCRDLIRRLLLCFAVIFLLSGWWYMLRIKDVLALRLNLLADGSLNIYNNVRHAYKFLCNRSIYGPLFILFLFSFPFLFLKRTFEKFVIIVGVLMPILIFIFSPHASGFNSNRYFIPILPLIALSIANLVSLISRKVFRRLTVFILVVFCSIQFILININQGDSLKFSKDKHREFGIDIVEQGKIKPYMSKINFEGLLTLIDKEKKTEVVNLVFLGNFPHINGFFDIEAGKRGELIDIFPSVQNIMGGGSQSHFDNPHVFKEAEFVIALEDKQNLFKESRAYHRMYLIPKMTSFFNVHRNDYRKIAVFKDEYGGRAGLFQKKILKQNNIKDSNS